MTCDDMRQRLASEYPDKPAADQADHLAGCAGCRAWLRRLARLEEMLPRVSVPPSEPPDELLALFRSAGGKPVVPPAAQRLPSFRPKREGARQKLALALALAATLSLFALTWWALPHARKSPPNHDHAGKGPRSKTPRERLFRLADEARDCLDKVKGRPEDAAEVARQAARFRELLQRDLPHEVKAVSLGDRKDLLGGVANLLARARQDATDLEAAWRTKHPESARSLRQMADDAAQAEDRLRELLRV